MGYIKTLDDNRYLNHKFVVGFKIEKQQVMINPFHLYVDMTDGASRCIGAFPTREAASQEIERLIEELYVNKRLVVEVK